MNILKYVIIDIHESFDNETKKLLVVACGNLLAIPYLRLYIDNIYC